jgi:hypothetical protein
MKLKDCTLEQLQQQKEQLEKAMLEQDEFMTELNEKRMAEIDRCIKAKNLSSNFPVSGSAEFDGKAIEKAFTIINLSNQMFGGGK